MEYAIDNVLLQEIIDHIEDIVSYLYMLTKRPLLASVTIFL
jgi:hypothetical protein